MTWLRTDISGNVWLNP